MSSLERKVNPNGQGFMYWRLLTSNPTAARDIVLSDKPVISTETDRMDKGMLDQVSPILLRDSETDQVAFAFHRYFG
jgi:hypothetical protein